MTGPPKDRTQCIGPSTPCPTCVNGMVPAGGHGMEWEVWADMHGLTPEECEAVAEEVAAELRRRAIRLPEMPDPQETHDAR